MKDQYIFTSQRLGFRNWSDADLNSMHKINQDKEVMRYFPTVATKQQTKDFIARMQNQFKETSYCYFAVDHLVNKELIGFIGLMDQSFDIEFSPFTDIGWRLSQSYWNLGLATEGAKTCLEFAFNELDLKSVFATAPESNINSIRVMKKIGMSFDRHFTHPRLLDQETLKNCVLYSISK